MRIGIFSSIGGIAFFVLVFAGIGLTACRSAAPLTPQQEEGQHLYSVRCAHCHEDNDLALKKVPPDLHGVFRRTTLPSGAPATDAEVRRGVVLSGKNLMPSVAGRFTRKSRWRRFWRTYIQRVRDLPSRRELGSQYLACCGLREMLGAVHSSTVSRRLFFFCGALRGNLRDTPPPVSGRKFSSSVWD